MYRSLYHLNRIFTSSAPQISIKNMSSMVHKDFTFRQLLDYQTFTYTYILGDNFSRQAVIIDPVLERVQRDSALLKELDFNLLYAMNTHMHADHITGSGELRKIFPNCKSVISKNTSAEAQVYLDDSDVIRFGKFWIDCVSTPGHTDGCTTFILHEKDVVFSGDTLFVRGCGRTDFQQGSPELLYNSVHNKIFILPDHYTIFPGHDYNGHTSTTVGEEKALNPRLSKTQPQFIEIMKNLNLPRPKLIDVAIPANLVDGLLEKQESSTIH